VQLQLTTTLHTKVSGEEKVQVKSQRSFLLATTLQRRSFAPAAACTRMRRVEQRRRRLRNGQPQLLHALPQAWPRHHASKLCKTVA
jgi:hypothetical protein